MVIPTEPVLMTIFEAAASDPAPPGAASVRFTALPPGPLMLPPFKFNAPVEAKSRCGEFWPAETVYWKLRVEVPAPEN